MKIDKLLKPLEDDKKAKDFAREFISVFSFPAFGAISKAEVDNLVFGLLIEAGALKSNSQIYEIARDLNVTPAKARNLLFQWQLRSVDNEDKLDEALKTALTSVRFTSNSGLLTFGVESPLVREELRSRLKSKGIFPDSSFSSDIIKVSVEHFVEFLDTLVDDAAKKKIREALLKDKQIKDDSFKSLVIEAVKDVGKKAVGQGTTELAGKLVQAIFDGDVGNFISD